MIDFAVALGKYFIAKLNSSHRSAFSIFFQHFLVRLRKTMILGLAGFVCAILFTAGVLMTIFEMSTQYDEIGMIISTARLWSSVGIALFSAIAFLIVISPRLWRDQVEPENRSALALQEALTQVLLQFVQEREQQNQSVSMPQPQVGNWASRL